MKRLKATALAVLLLALAAWDTRVVTGDIWRSTYFNERSKSVPEHSTLADLALAELGVVDLFGVQGSADVTVVDLNASYFREDELGSMDREGDDRRTRVEERLIPQPARFAGLPDYSYGPADWLNKNLTCPIGGPPGYTRYCHDFIGWLGSLNSVHFGSQATRMYGRYHTLALDFAERARVMRARMTAEERLAHADALEEAEHQALIYEGYAQHFLQDRWAIGHMWERWDGPDRTQIDDRTMPMSLAIGAVAGFIHGSESSTGSADAMSSPLPGQDAARPMEFRHASRPDLPPVPAVGDERLADMRRGAFGKGYGGPDQPLDVRGQRREMLACSKAGWAEVIRALGPGDRGGFGAVGARLAPDAPEFRVLDDETCWDMWATNRSMYEGLVVTPAGDWKGKTGLSLLAELRVRPDLTGRGIGVSLEVALFKGSDLTALGWRMWRRQLLDPDGTDLARGGIGVMWNAQTGDKAGLPIYAEPLDPAALPDRTIGGVDRQTLYGAFSRAHSDHWGGPAAREMLDRLRRSQRDRMWEHWQQTCQFVADMAWQGTHPSYSGRMARRRMADGKPVRSLAHIRIGPREAESDDPADPFYIDQGYVSRTEARDRAPTFGSKAAANWCARVPVVRLSRDPDLRDANIVQVLPADARRIELFGENFGLEEGRVLFFEEGRRKRGRGRIVDWSDGRIQVNFRPGELRAGHDHLIEIRTEDGRRSVGLFVVRVRPAEEELPEPTPVAASCDAPPPQAAPFDLASAVTRRIGGDVFNAEPAALAGALRAASADLAAARAAPAAFLVSERQCLLSRRPGGVLAIDRVTREGRRAATREAEAYFEAQRAQGRSGGSWVKHCAASTGGPIRYGFTPTGTPFPEAEDFWLEYVEEIDGVLQHGEFAETFIAAWALALERRGPSLAPDPALTSGGMDLRIRDPEVLLQRYFRPLTDGTSELDRKRRQLEALRDADLWADAAMSLYAATSRGIVSRRAYETWLTTELRNQARDPIDALCRVEAGLSRPPPEFVMAPPGFADSYWTDNGRRYARKGWPQPSALPAQTADGRAGSAPEPPAPFTPAPLAPPALPALPAPPRTIPLRRHRAGRGKPRR
ncbi:MAG: hypothetical protein KKF88_02600 [Alphaproteobacteria bacterium]|nr:hypothetical protein [Alphaproteobacteria bacterium]